MPIPLFWQRLLNWLQPGRQGPSAPPPADREAMRHQRAQHRAQLQAVVRENMIRAGVLSGAYRFKTLPLDRAGNSFVVLFDVDAHAMDTDTHTLNTLEDGLQSLAQQRHHIAVRGAYWKVHHRTGTDSPNATGKLSAPRTTPR